MTVVYNPDNPTNQKWELIREYDGDASISFSITDTGQFRFSTTTIAGAGHEGWITFSAKALSQT